MLLTEWIGYNKPEQEKIWHDSFWEHANLLRSTLPRIFANEGEVIGTHVSKSIINPVVKFVYERVEIIFQYNYYNWQIMVNSEKPLNIKGLNNLNVTDYLYYQGIPEEYRFEKYSETNNKQFALSLTDDIETGYVLAVLLKIAIDE